MPSLPPNHEAVPESESFATVLGRAARQHLGLDVLGNDETARFFGHLLDDIDRLQGQVKYLTMSRNTLPPPPPADEEDDDDEIRPPTYHVLYQVVCDSSIHMHSGFLFKDEPKENLVNSPLGPNYSYWALNGTDRVADAVKYGRNNPDVCFLVIKQKKCSGYSGRDQQTTIESLEHTQQKVTKKKIRIMSPRAEKIWIVAESLKTFINSIATYKPEDLDVPFEFGLSMEAPYVFFYHHWEILTAPRPHNDLRQTAMITLLVKFLEANYADDYAEARRLFSKGLVNRVHVGKLYRPFEQLTRHGEALVLSHPPVVSKATVGLLTWSWESTATGVRRLPANVMVDIDHLDSNSPVPITSLKCYPLAYGDPNQAKRLEDRGRKFWSMHNRCYCNYNGWDSNHENQYVSLHGNATCLCRTNGGRLIPGS